MGGGVADRRNQPIAGAGATPIPQGDLWTRPDGQERRIEYLWGPDTTEPPPLTLWGARYATLVDLLDERIPAWEDSVYLGGIAGALCALFLLVLVR